MLTDTRDRTTDTLARSLPLVQRHKYALPEGLEAALRSCEEPDEAFAQAEVAAMMLRLADRPGDQSRAGG